MDERWRVLPENIVEIIITMMPLPHIFKARCLSRSWRARLSSARSSVSTEQNEEKKYHAAYIQSLVQKWSPNWETFYPVFVCREKIGACKKTNGVLQPMSSSLYFLPRDLGSLHMEIEGALLFACPRLRFGPSEEIYVANILTQAWKPLPPRPNAAKCLRQKLVSYPSSQKYKVILLCMNVYSRESFSQIYDSELTSWSNRLAVSNDFGWHRASLVFFNGVLYAMNRDDPCKLLALNVEQGTWKELRIRFVPKVGHGNSVKVDSLHLVVCNASLLMVVDELITSDSGNKFKSLRVVRIDKENLQTVELTRARPPAWLSGIFHICGNPVGVSGSIFLVVYPRVMVVYNVAEDRWSVFQLHSGAGVPIWSVFQPGLNPFVEV